MSAQMLNQCHIGDCRELLRDMAAAGVRAQMCVTSPPYWGLRDYGAEGQIGLEPTLAEWIGTMVEVFRAVRDVLADDGTLWLNLGDAYASAGGAGWQGKNGQRADRRFTATRNSVALREIGRRPPPGLKPKDLMGQPWRVAFALQDDGWYLRRDIIWHKLNPMPESVRDRPTTSHEYLFLFAKSESYYYDADAIKEPASTNTHARIAGWATGPGAHSTLDHTRAPKGGRKLADVGSGTKQNGSFDDAMRKMPEARNKRSVWSIASEPYSEAHFATFPRKLIEPCILAGSRPGDIVLDPFMGSGTTAQVAEALGRQWIGCEINPEYVPLQQRRTAQRALVLE